MSSDYYNLLPDILECEPLVLPENATINGNMNKIGSRVAVSCPADYQPVGRTIVTCTENGTWSPGNLTCTQVNTCYM